MIEIKYRFDGESLYNLDRLSATSKVAECRFLEFQYADDAAIVATTNGQLHQALFALDSIHMLILEW